MMQIISDVHLESRDGKVDEARYLSPSPGARFLALLGDIGCLDRGLTLVWYKRFLARCCEKWEKVFLLMGNHEYYGCSMDNAVKTFMNLPREKGLHNLVPLERTRAQISPGVVLLGATLWSQIPKECARDVSTSVTDYRKIRLDHGKVRLTPECITNLHSISMDWLEKEIDKCQKEGTRAIVLTHHSPLPPSADDRISCAWSTDLSKFMQKWQSAEGESPLKCWCFGHTHRSFRGEVNGVPVYSNQMGYSDPELCGFDPRLTIPVQ